MKKRGRNRKVCLKRNLNLRKFQRIKRKGITIIKLKFSLQFIKLNSEDDESNEKEKGSVEEKVEFEETLENHEKRYYY